MSDITNDQEAACTYSHVCLTDRSELIDDLKTGLLHNALSAASWKLKVSSSFCLQIFFPTPVNYIYLIPLAYTVLSTYIYTYMGQSV
jgi:hypothetical protein